MFYVWLKYKGICAILFFFLDFFFFTNLFPNWVDYCDETLHTHWYWQDVAQEIVKCHLGLAEALPRFKFYKNSETGPIPWNFFEYFDTIMHKHCYWRELDRGIAKCHLFLLKFCIIIDIDKI